MKKLTNKKGFTLIEMLVVIAIIAVLVAIIIPVVTNSTVKAAAAANAANMRSLKSEIATSYLQDQSDTNKDLSIGDGGVVTLKNGTDENGTIKYPAMKAIDGVCAKNDGTAGAAGTGNAVGNNWEIKYENNGFTVKYAGKTIDQYATIAEEGLSD